jgi:hypothetical protein
MIINKNKRYTALEWFLSSQITFTDDLTPALMVSTYFKQTIRRVSTFPPATIAQKVQWRSYNDILEKYKKFDNLNHSKLDLYLTEHWIRVDLAHVNASIWAVNVSDVQRPRVQVAVEDRQPGVVGQNSVVHGQNAFIVGLDPGHLYICTRQMMKLFVSNCCAQIKTTFPRCDMHK